MSVEAAKALLERIKSDEEFAQKFIGCQDPESRVAFIQELGYDISKDELLTAGELLTDDELDNIQGGEGWLSGLLKLLLWQGG